MSDWLALVPNNVWDIFHFKIQSLDPSKEGESTKIAERSGAHYDGDPSFELFSLVVGTLDSLIGLNQMNSDFGVSTIDPLVSYDGTSLMNMPKSTFIEMIDDLQTHPSITSTNVVHTKSSYQDLMNEAGNTAATSQVFWNLFSDNDAPINLSSDQLDAMSLALTQANANDDTQGYFCGTLNSVNQILRNGMLTDQEADAIIREIQKNPVSYKNVATLMEVMNYLTDATALQAAGVDYSGVPGKSIPSPQARFNQFCLDYLHLGF